MWNVFVLIMPLIYNPCLLYPFCLIPFFNTSCMFEHFPNTLTSCVYTAKPRKSSKSTWFIFMHWSIIRVPFNNKFFFLLLLVSYWLKPVFIKRDIFSANITVSRWDIHIPLFHRSIMRTFIYDVNTTTLEI